MDIMKLKTEHLDGALEIYAEARAFMRRAGNLTQWQGGYPPRERVLCDINDGNLYGLFDNGALVGVFYFAIGSDPTYAVIYDGAWLNDAPYGVIHRIAISDTARGRGAAALCFDFAFSLSGNLKIDTHKDNLPMQRALEKRGFVRCGIIHLESGDERIAYQRIS